jgi:hypothetical protein
MFWLVLVVLFLAVFGFLAWIIISRNASAASRSDETYICPDCNEYHCDCRRQDDPD